MRTFPQLNKIEKSPYLSLPFTGNVVEFAGNVREEDLGLPDQILVRNQTAADQNDHTASSHHRDHVLDLKTIKSIRKLEITRWHNLFRLIFLSFPVANYRPHRLGVCELPLIPVYFHKISICSKKNLVFRWRIFESWLISKLFGYTFSLRFKFQLNLIQVWFKELEKKLELIFESF